MQNTKYKINYRSTTVQPLFNHCSTTVKPPFNRLGDFPGFYFAFKELEYIDCSLIVEATFGIVEFGEGG